MAEDPKLKKKSKKPSTPAAAGPSGEPPVLASNPNDSVSADEWMAQYNQAMQPKVPGVAAESTKAPTARPADPQTIGATPDPHRSFFDSVLRTLNPFDAQDDGEIGGAVVRGATKAGNEVVRTALEGGATLAHVTGLGEKMLPGFDKAYADGGAHGIVDGNPLVATEDDLSDAIAPKSDDPIAGFVEGASQFMTGMWLAGKAGIKGEGFLSNVAKGAVADMTVFDPHEAQLAELAARSGVPGVQYLGKMLSVSGDDGFLAARFKRAAAGAMTTALMDGMIASVRYFGPKGLGKLKSPTATPEEKWTAVEFMKKEQAVAEEAVAAPAAPTEFKAGSLADRLQNAGKPKDVVEFNAKKLMIQVVPDAELDAHFKAAHDAELATFHEEEAAHDAQLKAEADARVTPQEKWNATIDQARAIVGDEEWRRQSGEVLDAAGLRGENAPPNAVEQSSETLQNLANKIIGEDKAARAPKAPDLPSPRFQPSEGIPQAASLNQFIGTHLNDMRPVAPEEVTATVDRFKESISGARTEDELRQAIDNTRIFNGDLVPGPERVVAVTEGLVKSFGTIFEDAQIRGKHTIEDVFKLTDMIAGNIQFSDAPAAVKAALGEERGRAVWNLFANRAVKELSEHVADLSLIHDARPHDAAAEANLRDGLVKLLETQRILASENSEWGLEGRVMQERRNPMMDGKLPFKDVEPRVRQAVEDAKQAVEDAKKEMADAEAKASAGQAGPNTDTVRDPAEAAKLATDPAAVGVVPDVQEQGLNDGSPATQGANANDFILARARQKAIASIRRANRLLNQPLDAARFDPEVMFDNSSLRGERVKMLADSQRADPMAPVETGKFPTNPIEQLSKWIEGAETELDQAMKKAREPKLPKAQTEKEFGDVSPFDTARIQQRWQESLPEKIAGMDKRKIAALGRMSRIGNGEPRNALALAHAARTIVNTGNANKAMEVFANALLSGPKTLQTVPITGLATTAFDSVARMVAGVFKGAATGDTSLIREAADMMYGNFRYLGENLRTAKAAFDEGRSIINPQKQYIAFTGKLGNFVRAPSRVLIAGDEFVRVTNYRSYVRAKSLRLAREELTAAGLKGKELSNAVSTRVEDDLRASFDDDTGIALVKDALEHAEVPTMSGPLGEADQSFGAAMQQMTNNSLYAKFVIPFVKSSTNIMRYAWQSTPVLNLTMKSARETMARGGEEAAILHARSLLAGTVYAYGLHAAFAGNLTGRAPSDPNLKKLWLAHNQPYSIKLGNTWYSYRRMDPLGVPLGVIADLKTSIEELGHDNTDVQSLAAASVASLFSNFANKTYLQGVSDFFSAWDQSGSGDMGAAKKAERWLGNFASSFVPQGMSVLQTDDTLREVSSMTDAIMAKVPGWVPGVGSTRLPPKVNIFGEPVLKGGYVNRTYNMWQAKDAGRGVEEDLVGIERGIPSPAKLQEFGGLVDLTDRKWKNTAGKDETPYERWMELVRSPKEGKSLRADMESLVASDRWKHGSNGADTFDNISDRQMMAMGKVAEHYARARRQMLAEYPELRRQMRVIERAKGASIRGGDNAVQRIEQEFGRSVK